MDKLIKIIIVDDHEIFRNGLKMVLNKLKYVSVVGEASNGQEFLDLIRTCPTDLVLLDIEMPIMNGIDATKIALKEQPGLRIIALTMFNDEDYIQSMMDAGAKGFLIKNINKDTLDKAIQMVAMGGNYYSEELFDFFTRKVSKDEDSHANDLHLTTREKEILQLLVEGLSNKEIADRLFVSERTIVGHKTNLLSKTGCKNTVNLLAYSIKNKLVEI
ncbi:MAG: response regulator transcription factor [Bacteroidales bacterium]|nr:response regulator transcription factor [Bacteroidales bacterium]MCF8455814.1 response regulator transcription factor [Bacteroidales bacterium]